MINMYKNASYLARLREIDPKAYTPDYYTERSFIKRGSDVFVWERRSDGRKG